MASAAPVRSVRDFVVFLGASFLPRYYRQRWIGPVSPDLGRGALFTGIIQLLLCFALLIIGYFRWLADIGTLFAQNYIRSGGAPMSGEMYSAGVGVTAYVSYLLRPTTILLMYFAVEGAARLTAAVVTGETIPTLPLVLAALIQKRVARRRLENYWGALVPDVVDTAPQGYDLLIRSCRPKDWGSLVTLSYGGQLYIVAAMDTGPAPRRFLYLLKKLPRGTVARGLREYDPAEVVASVTNPASH